MFAKLRDEQVAKCYKPGDVAIEDVAIEDVAIWCDDNGQFAPHSLAPHTNNSRPTHISFLGSCRGGGVGRA
jgi:hypothetical protein